MPINEFLQGTERGRNLSKKYWFALDPLTLRVFARSKQHFDESTKWPQPEYAYSSDEEQEFSRKHYHFSGDPPHSWSDGEVSVETEESDIPKEIRMYLLQEWMQIGW